MSDEMHRYTLRVDGSEIKGLSSLNSDDLPPAAEIGSKLRGHLKSVVEMKHDPSRVGPDGRVAQAAFYEWMREVAETPVEPQTFDLHDETQGPDWLVVYKQSHFTRMQWNPTKGLDVTVAMQGREVWLRCPHGMISDDETEAMWLTEKALKGALL